MKINIKDLENINYKNDGTWGTFYLNGEKYTGTVYDIFDERINWIFEVNDGLQNGVEKTFYEGTDSVEQIAEYKNNLQFGISKEFNEDGQLSSVSIIFNDNYLKTIFLNNLSLIKKEENYNLNEVEYPEKIIKLLKLSDEDLIRYTFKDLN